MGNARTRFRASLISWAALFFLTLMFQSGEGLAQEQKVYSLGDSISEALAKNWSLRAKKEKIGQAIYEKNRARAEFLPKLSMNYGYTRFGKPRVTEFFIPGLGNMSMKVATQDNYQWKGTVTQPLFTGFALLSSFELAKLGIDQSKTELELEKLDLVLNVKEAYFGILEADKAVEVAKKAVESLESHVQVSRSFYKVGMIPVNDLLKSEVELANARQELVNAENASRLARSVFNTILAKAVHAPVAVEDILVFVPERGVFQDYLQKALEKRPEIRLIDISILQMDQQIRLAGSKNWPEIALQYDYIKEGDTPGVSGSEYHEAHRWEAMAVCSWTFWEWGKTHYSIRKEKSIRNELLQIRMSLEDNVELELKQAMLDLEAAEKNIPTTQKAAEQAEENLRVSEERYKAQVTTSTEVLDAQTLLTRARMNHYNALYTHNLAKARLQRAIGAY